MMTIGSVDVPVALGSSYQIAQWGEPMRRSFSGRARTNVRAHHRTINVTTSPLSSAEVAALRASLEASPPLSVSGLLVGSPTTCHVRDIRVTPMSADEWTVSFVLDETVESVDFVFGPWYFMDVDGEMVMTNNRSLATHYLDHASGELFVNTDREDADALLRYVRGDAQVIV